ncbi:hypothetical protein F2P56_012545 [Juglans regia]|uniref:Uncharacterized protein n=1 Tax=Juglans regia TaxID=51240 RepID=A0A834CYA7_JUGRE|nr:hypothetical protein F2P56_012545 [Juglans regia]
MSWSYNHIIDAHRAPLAAIVGCSNGMYIATASEQGTIIRVHLVYDATKVGVAQHPFIRTSYMYLWYLIYLFKSGFQRLPLQMVHKKGRKHIESNVALTLELIRKLITKNSSPQSVVFEKNLTRENEIRKREDALLLREYEAQKEKDKLIERENVEEARGRTSKKDSRE